jgi:hypothetical protein
MSNKNSYCNRAASTAVLRRGRMLSSKTDLSNQAPPPVSQNRFGPFVWITCFEENPKFGMAYLLNSNATGMRFNDSTCIVSNSLFQKMKYIDFLSKNESEKIELFDHSSPPSHLTKKFKIISYYQK